MFIAGHRTGIDGHRTNHFVQCRIQPYVVLLYLFPAVAYADAAVPMDAKSWSLFGVFMFVLFGFPVIGVSFLLAALFAKRKMGWLIWGGILLLISGMFWVRVLF